MVLASAYVLVQILAVHFKLKQYFSHPLHSVLVAAAEICVQT
jgi:hypothetical protein